jgi:hypothetical protein
VLFVSIALLKRPRFHAGYQSTNTTFQDRYDVDALLLLEQGLILLLSLDECFLEQVGICLRLVSWKRRLVGVILLSLLPKRMANV